MRHERKMTSCHHGHKEHPNNLEHAIEVLRENRNIGIIEIDFVQVGEDFISSHDYTEESIKQGSSLVRWVEQIVVKRDKILWIDIKSHVDFMAFFCCDTRMKFDCRALFRVLAGICKTLERRIQSNIWLSCQDKEVSDTFVRLNNRLKPLYKWTIINDIPFVSSYAWMRFYKALSLGTFDWVHSSLFNYFLTYDYASTRNNTDSKTVVCIDQSFFPSIARIIEFIEASTIPLGATIVLYTFDSTIPPISARGYTIIMQYDYANTRTKKVQSPSSSSSSLSLMSFTSKEI